ncbi:hypothetical protein CQ047_02255 [Microbacterium sp. MYb72]|nr:hypothetical protein CQ047_02255 [Microbacterium sp. MYb72]
MVPTRFASAVDALNETLEALSARSDRAELVSVLMRSFELWLIAHVPEDPRTQVGTMATEHETAETLAAATRSYWMSCMAAGER